MSKQYECVICHAVTDEPILCASCSAATSDELLSDVTIYVEPFDCPECGSPETTPYAAGFDGKPYWECESCGHQWNGEMQVYRDPFFDLADDARRADGAER